MEYKSIVLTALITTAIGLSGNYIYNKVEPSIGLKIIPSSFGFSSPDDDLIPVPRKLFDMTKESHYRSFKKKEVNYDELETVRNISIEQISDMEKGVVLSRAWLNQHALDIDKSKDDINYQLKKSAIHGHPIFEPNQEFLGMTFVKLRRGQLSAPPKNLDEMQHLPNMIPVKHFETDKHWEIHGSLVKVPFPYKTLPPEQELLTKNIVRSFSRGAGENIAHFTNEYIEYASSSILLAQKIKEELEALLVNSSRLSVVAIIENTGDIAITMKPFYLANLTNGEFSHSILLRAVNTKRSNKKYENATPHFLPRADETNYLNVKPGESKNIDLISIDPLEDEGAKINNLYNTELLKLTLHGLTTEDIKFNSTPVGFSRTIYKDDRNFLLAE